MNLRTTERQVEEFDPKQGSQRSVHDSPRRHEDEGMDLKPLFFWKGMKEDIVNYVAIVSRMSAGKG
jgi:hypothetical protein